MCWERGRWGLEMGEGLLEGRQVVESEGTPFPCGLGDDPHPVRLRADPLWLCLSPPKIDPSLLLHPPL